MIHVLLIARFLLPETDDTADNLELYSSSENGGLS
jgi:hypothetical protein